MTDLCTVDNNETVITDVFAKSLEIVCQRIRMALMKGYHVPEQRG